MSVDEWDHREVCPDGACTGVIGAEGRCKVCGQVSPTWNNERERGLVVDAMDDEADDNDDIDDDNDDNDHNEVAARGSDPALEALMPGTPSADAWSERELCKNDACIGVQDERHVCSVCGVNWSTTPATP